MKLLPVDLSHALEVRRLPHHHSDPFDRLLIAQAQVEGLTLVSADHRIKNYDLPILW
jgi:PIN domain nuclease of toxin-antitoxin system